MTEIHAVYVGGMVNQRSSWGLRNTKRFAQMALAPRPCGPCIPERTRTLPAAICFARKRVNRQQAQQQLTECADEDEQMDGKTQVGTIIFVVCSK